MYQPNANSQVGWRRCATLLKSRCSSSRCTDPVVPGSRRSGRTRPCSSLARSPRPCPPVNATCECRTRLLRSASVCTGSPRLPDVRTWSGLWYCSTATGTVPGGVGSSAGSSHPSIRPHACRCRSSRSNEGRRRSSASRPRARSSSPKARNRPARSTRTAGCASEQAAAMPAARSRDVSVPVARAASTASTGMKSASVSSSRSSTSGQTRSKNLRRCSRTACPSVDAVAPSGSRPAPSASAHAGFHSATATRSATARQTARSSGSPSASASASVACAAWRFALATRARWTAGSAEPSASTGPTSTALAS
jgi:hypothetical protein